MRVRLILAGLAIGAVVALTIGMPRRAPEPASAADASGVAAGLDHSCALTTSGGVKCWGRNADGQLGDGTTDNSATPEDVSGLSTTAVVVVAGDRHSCALLSGGGVQCWGDNQYGQLGDGTTTDRPTAVDVSGLTSGVTAISAGAWHTCALLSGGGVQCWGDNGFAQLGDGTTTDHDTPEDVCASGSGSACSGGSALSGVAQISTQNLHTCARMTADGGVKCWGLNDDGQLGNDSSDTCSISYDCSTHPVDVCNTGATTPCSVDLLTGTSSIGVGAYHSCAVKSGGVKCWGWNSLGQLGDGTTNDSTTPVDVCATGSGSGCSGGSALSGMLLVGGGASHTCGGTSTGGSKCWGNNGSGQLGDGTTTDRWNPVDVCAVGATPPCTAGNENIIAGLAGGALGSYHGCVIFAAGTLACAGSNGYGQLGDGTTMQRNVGVEVAGVKPTPTPTVCGFPGPTCTPTPTPTYTVLPTATPTPTPAPAPSIDITGTWNVSVAGDVTDTCVINANQAGSSLIADMSCQAIGSGTLTGTINVLTGSFSLSGTLTSGDVSFAGGTVDGENASGTWDNEFQQTGTFTGTIKSTTEGSVPAMPLDVVYPNAGGAGVGPGGAGSGIGEGASGSGIALYVAVTGNNQIRKIQPPEPGGKDTRVAGAVNGKAGSVGDNGDPLAASLNGPRDVDIAGNGDIYIADTENCVVRKVSGGIITRVAGVYGDCTYGGDGFAATSAKLNRPHGVTVDGSGNIYIADTDNCVVRKVSGGIITTVAGIGERCSYDGDGGDAMAAKLNLPHDVAFLGDDLVIADTGNHRVRRYDPASGVITLLAGSGTPGDIGDNGPATDARLNGPEAVAAAADRVFIADTQNNRIRRVNVGTGIITTFIGDGGELSADLNLPAGIAFAGSGGGGSGEAASDSTTGSCFVCDADGRCYACGGVGGVGDRPGDWNPIAPCNLVPGTSSIDWALPALLLALILGRKRMGALFIRLWSAAVRHPGRLPAEDAP